MHSKYLSLLIFLPYSFADASLENEILANRISYNHIWEGQKEPATNALRRILAEMN